MPIATINGTDLHYRVSGDGIPIVFIHPPLITSAVFGYQHAQLSGDMKVITFDVRGHGRSSASAKPVTYALVAEDIKQLLDRLGIEQAFVCGYSTGGSIALEAMLAYPDRFLGGILISAMSETSDPLLRSVIRLMAGLSRWRASLPLLKTALVWGNGDSGETRSNLRRGAKGGNRRNIRQYFRFSLLYNCTDRLSRIKAPVLLLYGDKDRIFKRYANLLIRELPQAELIYIRKEKHQLPTKSSDTLSETIRHWVHAQLPAGAGKRGEEHAEWEEAYRSRAAAETYEEQPTV